MEQHMTIDELAAKVGMTVRNIRAHQSRGLLPPPEIRGRTGYYGPAHVRRLERIQELQDKGLNLTAIGHVVTDGGLADLAASPFSPAQTRFAIDDLVSRLRVDLDDPAVLDALANRVIEIDGDEVIADGALIAVAERLVAQGIPIASLLVVIDQVRVATDAVAAAFMDLADRHVVVGLAERSDGDPEQVRVEVERLSQDAAVALGSMFNRSMAETIRSYLNEDA